MPKIDPENDPFNGKNTIPPKSLQEMLKAAGAHKKSVDKMDPNFNVFEPCSFPAHCRDLRWNRNGTLVIPLEVGFRYISLANNMIYSSGVPLAVHIERFNPMKFMEMQEAQGINDGD